MVVDFAARVPKRAVMWPSQGPSDFKCATSLKYSFAKLSILRNAPLRTRWEIVFLNRQMLVILRSCTQDVAGRPFSSEQMPHTFGCANVGVFLNIRNDAILRTD